MDFSYEQIMNYGNYRYICELFFGLAKDEETRKLLEDILYTGRVGEYIIYCDFQIRDNPSIERQRRISMAYLLVNNPETFRYIVDNNINLFHGTNANALPGIIKYGLNSGESLEKKNEEIKTGEYSPLTGKRSFISFTDLLDLSRDYASIPAKGGVEELSFGVVIGTTVKEIRKGRTCRVASELPEIGVVDSFPLDRINCVMVPKDKVKLVRRMLSGYNITVLAISPEEEKFYYCDNTMGIINVYNDKYEELKNNLSKPKKKFSLAELEQLVKGVSAKKMWGFLKGLKPDMNPELKEAGEEYVPKR